jgi:autotransporter-associated beta strand protein
VSSAWSNSGNWFFGGVPTEPGADIVFGDLHLSGAKVKATVNDLTSTLHIPAQIHIIVFDDAGYSIAGDPIQLSGDIVSDTDAGSLGASACQVLVNISLTGNQTHALVADTGDQLIVNGSISGGPQATLEVNGPVDTTETGQDQDTPGPDDNIIPSGGGEVDLGGANTYSGQTILADGTLLLQNSSALGTANGTDATGTQIGDPLVPAGKPVLELAGGINIGSEALVVLNSNAPAALVNVAGNNSWAGDITLDVAPSAGGTSNTTIAVDHMSDTLTLTGIIQQPFVFPSPDQSLTKDGPGTLLVGTAPGNDPTANGNIYQGGTTVLDGTLIGAKTDAFNVGPIDVLNTAVLEFVGTPTQTTGPNQSDPEVGVFAPIILDSTAPAPLVNLSGFTRLFEGVQLDTDVTIDTRAGTLFVGDSGGGPGISESGGPRSLTKTGAGTLEFDAASTYSGTTFINQGLTLFNVTGGLSVPTDLVITGGTAQDLQDEQIDDPGAVTVNSPGVLDLNGHAETVGPLTLADGTVLTGTGGTLLLNRDVAASGPSATIQGPGGFVKLNGATRTFSIASAGTLTISAVIERNGGLTLQGADGTATLVLSGANTYTGTTTLNAGVLDMKNASALGAPVAGTIVKSGAVLEIDGLGSGNPVNEPLTLNGSGVGGGGALVSVGGPNTWAGTIDLASDSVVGVPSDLTLSGSISGPGGLTEVGGADLTLSGNAANTYGGTTTVSAGALDLAKSSGMVAVPGDLVIAAGATVNDDQNEQIGNSASVTVNGGTFNLLANFSETIGALTLNGGSATTGAGSTLTVGPLTSSGGSVTTGVGSTVTAGPLALTGGSITTGSGSTLTAGPVTLTGGTITTGAGAQVVLTGDVTATLSPSIGGSGTLSLGNSTRTFTVSSGSDQLTVSTPITGGGAAGVTKAGSGTLTFSGTAANTYPGTTTVLAGTLLLSTPAGVVAVPADLMIGDNSGAPAAALVSLQADDQIAHTAAVTLNGSGVLRLNAHTETVGSVSDSGTIDLGGGTVRANSLSGGGTITGPGTVFLTGSTPSVFKGTLVAGAQIIQQGTGGLTFGLQPSSTGAITVTAGMAVALNGSSQPSVTVTVEPGGTLGGTGTVGTTTVAPGGKLLPGDQAGDALNISGGLTFSPGATLDLSQAGVAPGGASIVDVKGQLDLGGPGGTILVLPPTLIPANRNIKMLTLIQADGGVVSDGGSFNFLGKPLLDGSLLLGRGSQGLVNGSHTTISYNLANGQPGVGVGLQDLDQLAFLVRALFDDLKVPLDPALQAKIRNQSNTQDDVVTNFLASPAYLMGVLSSFYTSLGQQVPFQKGSAGYNTYQNYLGQLETNTAPDAVFAELAVATLQLRPRGFVNTIVAGVLGSTKAISKQQRDLWVLGLKNKSLSRSDVIHQLLTTDQAFKKAIQENRLTFLGVTNVKEHKIDPFLTQLEHGQLSPADLTHEFLKNGTHLAVFTNHAVAGIIQEVGPDGQLQRLVAVPLPPGY